MFVSQTHRDEKLVDKGALSHEGQTHAYNQIPPAFLTSTNIIEHMVTGSSLCDYGLEQPAVNLTIYNTRQNLIEM